jgi:hypothetical protein
VLAALGQSHQYHRRVFLAPPWPEIYVTDRERRHGLEKALAEYGRVLEVYPSLGYAVSVLPKIGVPERADFMLRASRVAVSVRLGSATRHMSLHIADRCRAGWIAVWSISSPE